MTIFKDKLNVSFGQQQQPRYYSI